MLTRVMNNTQLTFRVVLALSRNTLSGRLYLLEPKHPWFEKAKYTRAEEPLNEIPNLEFSDMLQN